MPDFVTREDFDWAVRKDTAKKKQDFSKLSDRSVETCEAYRRGRACGSLPFHLISFFFFDVKLTTGNPPLFLFSTIFCGD